MALENLEFVDRATELVESAREHEIPLRILGSLAYRLHCPQNLDLFDAMKRDLTDVDFAARSDGRKDLRAFLEGRGYVIDQDVLVATEGARYCFADPNSSMLVDVFFDELFFCHQIPLKDRLELDYPTISLADLILEKMQIVEINAKDIKDTLVLLLEHPLGSGEREEIDAAYIAKLLAADWGFYYTVTTNLGKLGRLGAEHGKLSADQWTVVGSRIEELERMIEEEPKTRRWKIRARIGPRVKWYQEVAEKTATY
jgi:hypothetical protein